MTTWLTQIYPDFRNRAAHQDLRDAVRMHQRVMSLVPDGLGDQPRQQAGVLYRVEEMPGGARILVQTQLKPDLERLPAGYGTAQARDLELLLRWLAPGRAVRYRLAANTCLRKSHSKEVVPLRGADAEKWWLDRAPGCGLDLLDQPFPGTVGQPQPVPLVDRLPRSEAFAQVTPVQPRSVPGTRFRRSPAGDPATARTGHAHRQERPQPFPLSIRQITPPHTRPTTRPSDGHMIDRTGSRNCLLNRP